MYRDANQLPPKKSGRTSTINIKTSQTTSYGIDDLENMSKEELIEEIIKARISEARLKKGYEVRGDGTVIRYVSKNTK